MPMIPISKTCHKGIWGKSGCRLCQPSASTVKTCAVLLEPRRKKPRIDNTVSRLAVVVPHVHEEADPEFLESENFCSSIRTLEDMDSMSLTTDASFSIFGDDPPDLGIHKVLFQLPP